MRPSQTPIAVDLCYMQAGSSMYIVASDMRIDAVTATSDRPIESFALRLSAKTAIGPAGIESTISQIYHVNTVLKNSSDASPRSASENSKEIVAKQTCAAITSRVRNLVSASKVVPPVSSPGSLSITADIDSALKWRS